MAARSRKKKKPMPRWIWQLPRQVLNWQTKRLLAYIWWCADRGCRDWNYQLALRFKVCDRQVRRWIKKLDDEHLITINFRSCKTRTLYRKPYFSPAVWDLKCGRKKDLTRRTKMSYTNNAQHSKSYKTNSYYGKPEADVGKKTSRPSGRPLSEASPEANTKLPAGSLAAGESATKKRRRFSEARSTKSAEQLQAAQKRERQKIALMRRGEI